LETDGGLTNYIYNGSHTYLG